MTQQGAAVPSFAPRGSRWGRFLGPFGNCCASVVSNLPVSRCRPRYGSNALIRANSVHSCSPNHAQATSRFDSRSLHFWVRRFATGVSGRNPVLERGYSNLTTISVSADCCWLRGGERGVAMVCSLDCFVTTRDDGNIVSGWRGVWFELSDPRNSQWSVTGIAGCRLGSILYHSLTSSRPCPWRLVGHYVGIRDRWFGISALWCGVSSVLPNASDFIWARRIGRANSFRGRLRYDSGLRPLFGWFTTTLGYRDWASFLLGTYRGSGGCVRILGCHSQCGAISRWSADNSSSCPSGISKG